MTAATLLSCAGPTHSTPPLPAPPDGERRAPARRAKLPSLGARRQRASRSDGDPARAPSRRRRHASGQGHGRCASLGVGGADAAGLHAPDQVHLPPGRRPRPSGSRIRSIRCSGGGSTSSCTGTTGVRTGSTIVTAADHRHGAGLAVADPARASGPRVEGEDGTGIHAQHRAGQRVVPGQAVAEAVRQRKHPLAHRDPREHGVDEGGRRPATHPAARRCLRCPQRHAHRCGRAGRNTAGRPLHGIIGCGGAG